MGWRALYFQYLSNVFVLHSVFNLTLCPVVKTNTEASRRAGDLSRTWAFFSFPGKMSKSRGVLEIQTRKHFLGPHYGYGVSEWLATEDGCHFLLSRSLQDESVQFKHQQFKHFCLNYLLFQNVWNPNKWTAFLLDTNTYCCFHDAHQ